MQDEHVARRQRASIRQPGSSTYPSCIPDAALEKEGKGQPTLAAAAAAAASVTSTLILKKVHARI